jgi:hypothetical protein
MPPPFLRLPQAFGRIEDMLVCDNMADHLIGNVYIKFSDEEEAAAALTALNGRWYAGRQASGGQPAWLPVAAAARDLLWRARAPARLPLRPAPALSRPPPARSSPSFRP